MSTVVQTETDYEIGQDNVRILGLDIHNPVFFISAVVIVGFVILVLMFQEGAAVFFGWLRPWPVREFVTRVLIIPSLVCALQAASFAIVLLLMCVCIFMGLREERRALARAA